MTSPGHRGLGPAGLGPVSKLAMIIAVGVFCDLPEAREVRGQLQGQGSALPSRLRWVWDER